MAHPVEEALKSGRIKGLRRGGQIKLGTREERFKKWKKINKDWSEFMLELIIDQAVQTGIDELNERVPVQTGRLKKSITHTEKNRKLTGFVLQATYAEQVEELYQAGGGRQPAEDGKGFVEGAVDHMLNYLREQGVKGIRRRGTYQIGGRGGVLPAGTRITGGFAPDPAYDIDDGIHTPEVKERKRDWADEWAARRFPTKVYNRRFR